MALRIFLKLALPMMSLLKKNQHWRMKCIPILCPIPNCHGFVRQVEGVQSIQSSALLITLKEVGWWLTNKVHLNTCCLNIPNLLWSMEGEGQGGEKEDVFGETLLWGFK